VALRDEEKIESPFRISLVGFKFSCVPNHRASRTEKFLKRNKIEEDEKDVIFRPDLPTKHG